MDTTLIDSLDALAGRLPDLRRYATVLAGIARGIQGGTIKVRR